MFLSDLKFIIPSTSLCKMIMPLIVLSYAYSKNIQRDLQSIYDRISLVLKLIKMSQIVILIWTVNGTM